MVEKSVEILLAEDSLTQAHRLRHFLEEQGYAVTHAVNGRDALDIAKDHKPDLVISDVIMPEMDGYELCHQIKTDPVLGDIPVILVTTLSDPQDVIRGLKAHADNFILKPYDERYLLSRVQFVLLNREMRNAEHAAMGVSIFFNGERHFITADRLQILNLLLSTYEVAIQQNKELSRARDDLHKANAQLEAANKELEAFSYSVSHDLRTPLRHIGGFVELLVKHMSGSLDAKGERYLTTIADSTRQMGQLIDDLLNFSRTAFANISHSEVHLNELVQEVLSDLKVDHEGRNIAWELHPLPEVVGDESLLRQVFVNLISNAIKYTRKRDQAHIEIGALPEAPDEHVLFVRDNGAGFDMKYVHKLFNVFQRLHRADEFEGTGIGLATVRRIVTRHGGRISAEGEEGEGATFYFSLPKRADAVNQ